MTRLMRSKPDSIVALVNELVEAGYLADIMWAGIKKAHRSMRWDQQMQEMKRDIRELQNAVDTIEPDTNEGLHLVEASTNDDD